MPIPDNMLPPDRGFIGGQGPNAPAGFGLTIDPQAAVMNPGGVTLYHVADESQKAEQAAARGDEANYTLGIGNAQGFLAQLKTTDVGTAQGYINSAVAYHDSIAMQVPERAQIASTSDGDWLAAHVSSDADKKAEAEDEARTAAAAKYPAGSTNAALALEGLDPNTLYEKASTALSIGSVLVPLLLIGVVGFVVFKATR